jgi:LysR family glycine cleavage system transcriptional activator
MENAIRHLNALRVFEAAARHSSFAKAGAELNVSHSVISQHIRNLEGWFGTDLFIRHGNRVELSDEGRRLQPQLANGFQIIKDACEGLLRVSRQATLTISAEPAIASLWMRKRITEFCAVFPKIDIELRPAWHPPQLNDGHTDMIVHFETRLPGKGAKHLRLFPIDGFPACAPQLKSRLEAGGTTDWNSAPLVHDNGREIWHQWFLAHQPNTQNWQKGRVYSDLSLAIDAAVDGEGVILADTILCHKELETGALVSCDPRQIRCVWYAMAIPKSMSANSALATFVDWLVERVRSDEAQAQK